MNFITSTIPLKHKMIQEDLTKYGEDKSIEDKLTKEQKDFFKTSEGKYYATKQRFLTVFGLRIIKDRTKA